MKVKDFPNWIKVVFNDRSVLKSDKFLFSGEQWKAFQNLEVETKDGKTLVVIDRR